MNSAILFMNPISNYVPRNTLSIAPLNRFISLKKEKNSCVQIRLVYNDTNRKSLFVDGNPFLSQI